MDAVELRNKEVLAVYVLDEVLAVRIRDPPEMSYFLCTCQLADVLSLLFNRELVDSWHPQQPVDAELVELFLIKALEVVADDK